MNLTYFSRVLPMEQSGAFYYKRAQRKLGQMNYLRALRLLREAVRREPKNLDYRMELAETLTEMSLFDASNQVLFQMLHDDRSGDECYFGLGCNFLGLQEYGKARESFMMYVRRAPEGTYSEDARDLMDWLSFSTEDGALPPRIRHAARRGKQSLDEGAYDTAIRQLSRVLSHAPGAVRARNHLSLALHCAQRTEEAILEARVILAEHPENLHALCNLAVFLHASGQRDEAIACLEPLIANPPQDPGELSKLSSTLIDLERDEEALRHARALTAAFPFDKRALHLTAAACANLGRTQEAERFWRRILNIDPGDTVAQWYARTMRSQEESRPRVGAHFQVPHDEIIARIRSLNAAASQGLDAMKEMWREDGDFKALLLWGTGLTDRSIKLALLGLIALFADETAEGALRAFLTRHDESDDVKREVFGMLKRIDAREPYIATIEDALVEVRVSIAKVDADLPSEYDAVLRETLRGMSQRFTDDFAPAVAALWTAYARSLGPRIPALRARASWCAALECAYMKTMGDPVRAALIAELWGASKDTVRTLYKKILAARPPAENEL